PDMHMQRHASSYGAVTPPSCGLSAREPERTTTTATTSPQPAPWLATTAANAPPDRADRQRACELLRNNRWTNALPAHGLATTAQPTASLAQNATHQTQTTLRCDSGSKPVKV